MSEERKPGSPEAVEAGCTCPVLDNCNGAGVPTLDKDGGRQTAHWIDWDCPLHGPDKSGD